MKTIWQYPVKYVYGYSAAYGSTFHTGVDRTVIDGRTDIVVTVNGVSIGIAGTTGKSTGVHLHIGKWLNGRSYDPVNSGALFKNAQVTEIQRIDNSDNGKFVRVQADGYSWVYLHLASIPSTLKVGQKLIMSDISTTPKEVDDLFMLAFGRHADQSGLKTFTGKSRAYIIKVLKDSKEWAVRNNNAKNCVEEKQKLWLRVKAVFGK